LKQLAVLARWKFEARGVAGAARNTISPATDRETRIEH